MSEERTYFAVVDDAGMYLIREQAEAARDRLLSEQGQHLAPFVHVVEVRMIPLTPEEEAHLMNDEYDEKEARQYERQRAYDNAQRFQL